jgi:hypothetical protein
VRVVECPQSDFVAGCDLLAGTDEPCAGSTLFGFDDRADESLDRRVEAFHERVGVVEAAAVDPNDDLRSRRVERFPLQPLDRLAAHLAVEVAGARTCLEAGERRLVRRSPGHDDRARRGARPAWD